MSVEANAELIDRIYEASLLPHLWEGVMDELGALAGCDKAALFTSDGQGLNGVIANAAIRPAVEVFVRDGWAPRNEQGRRCLLRGLPDFCGDLDLFAADELAREPFYNEYLIPNGLAWGAGSAVQSPGGDAMFFSLHRALEHGPLERPCLDRLTALRPHLARAALTSTRLQMAQAQAVLQTLALLGLPAAALRYSGQLRVANDLFQQLLPGVIRDGGQRLMFVHKPTDALLSQALAQFGGARSFPLPGGEQHAPYIVHIMPIMGQSREVFASLDHLLLMVPVTRSGEVDSLLLQGLFDLTPSEARVAKGLLLGQALEYQSQQTGTGLETLRSQLKQVMAKTGTCKQVELVSLLAAVKQPKR